MASPRFVPRFGVPGWCRRHVAFTLVEMLVVISIVAILLALVAPAVTSMGSAGSLNRAAFDIAGSLDRARAYAMANNTYVWVGLVELNPSNNSTPAPGEIGGTVTLATVASTDGTRAYDPDALSADPNNPTALITARIKPIDRSLRFDSVHFADASQAKMSRPTVDPADEIGASGFASSIAFTAPANGGQQKFSKVIEYNPQGVTRVVASGAGAQAVPSLIQITLLPTRGTVLRANETNSAAIQVAGLTGALRMYRP